MSTENIILSENEGYMKGYRVLETLPSGIHVVRRRWGLGKGRPVIAWEDEHTFVSNLIPEFGFDKFNNIDDILLQVRNGKLEGVPYRIFATAPYPFHKVMDRRSQDHQWITLSVEFPVSHTFGVTGVSTVDDVLLDFEMSRKDWNKLDEKKNKLSGEYKKMKKAWRSSFQNK